MPASAPAVTLDPDLDPRHRWVLEALVNAAGARVAGDGPRLDAGSLPLDEAFFHLARLEELDGPADEHGRFPAAASRLAAGEAPLDELAVALRDRLAGLGVAP